jgi:glycosyltransferase involved in cell wall biosynthesis
MVTNKRFCVVTPNLNMGEYLEETIRSVIDNLDKNDEYYVIDGGSTDSSIDIIKKYENYITGWISEPDQGQSDAIAKGFNLTSSAFMCWINSGDLLLPDALKLISDKFNTSTSDLLFCDDYYIDEEGIVLQHTKGYVKNLKPMMLYGKWTPLQDACFWRRELYCECGEINKELKYAADYDLFLRMSLNGKADYFPAVVSAFRLHSSQNSIAYTKEYNEEKQISVDHALHKNNVFHNILPVKKILYFFVVHMRAYIPYLKRRGTKNIGARIQKLKSKLIN